MNNKVEYIKELYSKGATYIGGFFMFILYVLVQLFSNKIALIILMQAVIIYLLLSCSYQEPVTNKTTNQVIDYREQKVREVEALTDSIIAKRRKARGQ